MGAHISDVPGLVKQISTPADENASIMSVAAMLSTVGFRPGGTGTDRPASGPLRPAQSDSRIGGDRDVWSAAERPRRFH